MPTYEPTPEAFNQTIDALNAAKENGEQVITSDVLTTQIPAQGEQNTETSENMLSLDEMLAKKNGEPLITLQPSDTQALQTAEENEKKECGSDKMIDPCGPMKKAIEDYEKQQLAKKNVDIEGIPLVIDVNSEHTDTPPIIQPEIPTIEPVQEEAPATISLDQFIMPEPVPVPEPVPTPMPQIAPKAASSMDKLKQPKILIMV